MVMKGVVGDCRGYQLMMGAQDLRLAMENMRRLQDIFAQSHSLKGYTAPSGGLAFFKPRLRFPAFPDLSAYYQDIMHKFP